MANFSLSDRYALGATLALLALVLINQPLVMLIVSACGLIAGLLIVRRGPVRRAVFVALVAFAVSLAFGLAALWR